METVFERVGALDVHKAQVTACVRSRRWAAGAASGRGQHLAEFAIKLDCVATNILGASGRAMLDALVAGTTGRSRWYWACKVAALGAGGGECGLFERHRKPLGALPAAAGAPGVLGGTLPRQRPIRRQAPSAPSNTRSSSPTGTCFTTGKTHRDLGGDYYQRRDPNANPPPHQPARTPRTPRHARTSRRLTPTSFPIRMSTHAYGVRKGERQRKEPDAVDRTPNGVNRSTPSDGTPRPTRAVVLAGGLGMRMRPYTMVLPKPLIPIGPTPILEHIIRRLMSAGVRRVDLCLGRHLGALIQTYFSQATSLHEEVEIVCHWEDEPLGTAGALRGIEDLTEPFIVMNGDILTTLDFTALMEAHRRSGAALTIAMHRQEVAIDLGVIECENGSVTGYREKPSLDYDVSMGIYVYDPRALKVLPHEGPCQFPDMVLRLLSEGERVAPFRTDATWYDIGTLTEYERAVNHVRREPELFGIAA